MYLILKGIAALWRYKTLQQLSGQLRWCVCTNLVSKRHMYHTFFNWCKVVAEYFAFSVWGNSLASWSGSVLTSTGHKIRWILQTRSVCMYRRSLKNPEQGGSPTCKRFLVHVRRVVVRQMVIRTFDTDILDLPALVRVRDATWAELVFKQRLDLLQAPGFSFWQAAIDEEETQQGHAGVQEESSCDKQKHIVVERVEERETSLWVFSINMFALIHHQENWVPTKAGNVWI